MSEAEPVDLAPSVADEECLCLRHVAARFGVFHTAIRRWEAEGTMPASRRVGGRRVYSRAAVERVLAECGPMRPPYPHADGSWRVPLFGKEIRRREAIVDAASMPLVEGRRWCWAWDFSHEGGHVALSHDGETTTMRRILMGVSDPGLSVANVNGDGLDCRLANLVVRPIEARGFSKRKGRTTHGGRPPTSQYKGVCRVGMKWLAQIQTQRKTKHLGRYEQEIDAALAYDAAAREMFGDNARPNFPDAFDAALARAA